LDNNSSSFHYQQAMTNQQHPITPSPELVQQWVANATGPDYEQVIATQAARWGSDQELEACCEWFVRDWTDIETADKLRAVRRPKPPNKKQRGLTALEATNLKKDDPLLYQEILNAIEALPND
jgi:hypothetical protein